MRVSKVVTIYFALFVGVMSSLQCQIFNQTGANFLEKSALKDKEQIKMVHDAEMQFWTTNAKEIYNIPTPEKWKDKSAIILSYFSETKINRDSKIFDITVRKNNVIRILNAAALENFSELSFISDGDFDYADIKIIKADGSSEVVNFAKNAILEKVEGESYYKIALPNLEVGDVLDIVELHKSNIYLLTIISEAYEPNYLLLHQDFPIVNYDLNYILSQPHMQMNAQLMNYDEKALTKSTFTDGKMEYVKYSLQLKNLEDYDDDINWIFPYVQIPNFRYQLYTTPTQGNRVGELNIILTDLEDRSNQKISKQRFEEYVANYIEIPTNSIYRRTLNSELLENFNKYLSSEKLSIKNFTKEELVGKLYHFYRAYYPIFNAQFHETFDIDDKRNISHEYFLTRMSNALSILEIPYSLIPTFDRRYSTVENFLFVDDFEFIIRVDLEKPIYLTVPDLFNSLNEISSFTQGTKALVFKNLELQSDTIILPSTKPMDNGHEVQVNLNLSNDFSTLKVDRNLIIKGYNKNDFQYNLINHYKYAQEILDEFNISTREDLSSGKLKETVSVKQNEMMLEKEKLIKEFVVYDINDDFSFDIEETDEFEVIQYGNTPEHPHLIYKDAFTANDVAKSMGPNYLFPIGMFIGGQVEIEEYEKDRDIDIYRENPCQYSYNITLTIPDGYHVTELGNLNINVDNSTGSFISKATIEGNKLNISTLKVYKNYQESKENWADMIAFLDAAYKFTQQKVLIRKV
jgi:hypothetical protein